MPCTMPAAALWVRFDLAHMTLLSSRQKKSDNSFTFYAKCGQSVAVYLSDPKFSNQKGPLVSSAAASFYCSVCAGCFGSPLACAQQIWPHRPELVI